MNFNIYIKKTCFKRFRKKKREPLNWLNWTNAGVTNSPFLSFLFCLFFFCYFSTEKCYFIFKIFQNFFLGFFWIFLGTFLVFKNMKIEVKHGLVNKSSLSTSIALLRLKCANQKAIGEPRGRSTENGSK